MTKPTAQSLQPEKRARPIHLYRERISPLHELIVMAFNVRHFVVYVMILMAVNTTQSKVFKNFDSEGIFLIKRVQFALKVFVFTHRSFTEMKCSS